MRRTLRGAWSRRGTLVPLLLLTTVVVAGVVAVTALAEASDTSVAVAVPLLVLGTVAVPTTGRQLAATRRREIAMARLRGITGGQLYVVLSLEPLLVLLAGAVLGLGLGAAVTALAGDRWAGIGPTHLGVTVLPPVAIVVVVALVAVLVGMAGALREPLADQVSVQERPRPAGVAGMFWGALLVVAAVVVSYRATVAAGDDPGWVVLAGPAIVGLAAGQLAVWALRGLARLSVPWTANRGLRGFLASRRLARVAEAATPVRLVVAAAAVAAVALTGATQVDSWTDDTARLRAGAPYRVDLAGGASAGVDEALSLSRELDPDGQYLVAAALVPGEGTVVARRAFLDTERYDAVLGGFLDGTPADGIDGLLTDLRGGEGVQLATGDEMTVTVRGVSSREDGDLRPRVTVRYAIGSEDSGAGSADLTIPLDGGEATARLPLQGCDAGCSLTGITLGRARGDIARPYVVTELDFGGEDALALPWQSTSRSTVAGVEPGPVVVDDGLMALAHPPRQSAAPEDARGATPVLATTSATWGEEDPTVESPGGDDRAADVVGRLPALPLVEADGLLADLPLMAAGAPPTVPAAEVMVLAAADTPSGMLADLADAAGSDPVSLADVEDATALASGAVQARIYALMAGFCLVVALLVLAASVTRERVVHGREAAALRVVGVPLAQVRGSARREIGALTLTAVVATVAGGFVGVVLLLSNLTLVAVPLHAVPLDVGVTLLPLAAAAAVAALLVLVVGSRSRSVRGDTSRPAILREEV